MTLEQNIEALFALPADQLQYNKEADSILAEFLNALNTGTIRSAQRTGTQGDGVTGRSEWVVNTWVKHGILCLFRKGQLADVSADATFSFFDKDTLPTKPLSITDRVRVVPGGSTIRTGSYVAPGVICMPPMYVNIGAYIDEDTMIDSHALVGTCAQIGKRVHLSAAAQVGGVLEPIGARPVIIEDDVMIGGNCGVYEGVVIGARAVLGSGVILNASTPVYDIVNETILRSTSAEPLRIPDGAVVVAGSRAIKSEFARENGLSISTPLIVKYRDEKTDSRTALENALRE